MESKLGQGSKFTVWLPQVYAPDPSYTFVQIVNRPVSRWIGNSGPRAMSNGGGLVGVIVGVGGGGGIGVGTGVGAGVRTGTASKGPFAVTRFAATHTG